MAEQKKKFDLEAWKAQGNERVVTIDLDVVDLESQKVEIEEQIQALIAEKVQIQRALGTYKEPSKGNGHTGKVMIRPLLLAMLIEHEGEPMEEQDLVDSVQEEKGHASASSIKTSLRRLAQSHEHITVMEDGRVMYQKANDAASSA